MSSLTLERGLYDFKAAIDAPIASYFSSCVHCGLCAEACLFYVETGDPKYTPIRKLEPLRRGQQRVPAQDDHQRCRADQQGLSTGVISPELHERQD